MDLGGLSRNSFDFNSILNIHFLLLGYTRWKISYKFVSSIALITTGPSRRWYEESKHPCTGVPFLTAESQSSRENKNREKQNIQWGFVGGHTHPTTNSQACGWKRGDLHLRQSFHLSGARWLPVWSGPPGVGRCNRGESFSLFSLLSLFVSRNSCHYMPYLALFSRYHPIRWPSTLS